jgi:hypothetical protein
MIVRMANPPNMPHPLRWSVGDPRLFTAVGRVANAAADLECVVARIYGDIGAASTFVEALTTRQLVKKASAALKTAQQDGRYASAVGGVTWINAALPLLDRRHTIVHTAWRNTAATADGGLLCQGVHPRSGGMVEHTLTDIVTLESQLREHLDAGTTVSLALRMENTFQADQALAAKVPPARIVRG